MAVTGAPMVGRSEDEDRPAAVRGGRGPSEGPRGPGPATVHRPHGLLSSGRVGPDDGRGRGPTQVPALRAGLRLPAEDPRRPDRRPARGASCSHKPEKGVSASLRYPHILWSALYQGHAADQGLRGDRIGGHRLLDQPVEELSSTALGSAVEQEGELI